MKTMQLAALALLLLSLDAHAQKDAAPPTPKQLVQVKFTYVDTNKVFQPTESVLPRVPKTSGDALAVFLQAAQKAHVLTKVVPGPTLTALDGQTQTYRHTHDVPATSVGYSGADWRLGPVVAVHPTIGPNGLISVVESMADMEAVGPAGYWFPKPKVVSADARPIFQARSGSTVYVGGAFSSDHIERYTFATVTVLPMGKG